MPLPHTHRPYWLTFDCYGTLIQWDEGLRKAVDTILRGKGTSASIETERLIEVYDRHEHRLEQLPPHRNFRTVAGEGLRLALEDFDLEPAPDDIAVLTQSISAMPPFPEVVPALRRLKAMGFRTCIVSNTDDDIIAGNVAQLADDNGHYIDRVITAQQAGAYKPNRRLFDYAHEQLGVSKEDVVHICASPHLDHAAARDIGFRCVWVDRGTGRKLLPNYTPDAIVRTLDEIPALFETLDW